MMKKLLFLLVLLVAGCAPAAVPATGSTAAAPATLAAALPTATLASRPVTPSAAPTRTAPAASQTPALPQIPLSQAVLQAQWDAPDGHPQLFPADPTSGTPLPGYAPIPLGGGYYTAFSPDHRLLAVVSFPNNAAPAGGVLHFIVPAAWTDRATTVKMDGWPSASAFSPDGSKLALATEVPWSAVRVIDVASGALLGEYKLADQQVEVLQFTRDGSALMAFSGTPWDPNKTNHTPAVLLLDAATLQLRWQQTLPGVRYGFFAYPHNTATPVDPYSPDYGYTETPGLAFSPVADTLYIVHSDENRLTTVDFAKRALTTRAIQPKLAFFDWLLNLGVEPVQAKSVDGHFKSAVLSPDGQRLYITGRAVKASLAKNGDWNAATTFDGLSMVDPASATELAHLDAQGDTLRLGPDGSHLFLYDYSSGVQSTTQVVSAADLKVLATLPSTEPVPAQTIGGTPLLVSTFSDTIQTLFTTLDPQTFQPLRKWSVRYFAEWVH